MGRGQIERSANPLYGEGLRFRQPPLKVRKERERELVANRLWARELIQSNDTKKRAEDSEALRELFDSEGKGSWTEYHELTDSLSNQMIHGQCIFWHQHLTQEEVEQVMGDAIYKNLAIEEDNVSFFEFEKTLSGGDTLECTIAVA